MKYHRERQGISLRKMAKAMNMTAPALLEIERNDGTPRADRLFKGSLFLKVPYEDFFEQQESEHPATALSELLGIPVIAEGAALNGDSIDYVLSGTLGLMKRKVFAVLAHGDCLEPEVKEGDLLLVDIELLPRNGDIVIAYMDDKIQIKRFREANGEKWLENRYGKIKVADVQLRGVVIEKNVKMR